MMEFGELNITASRAFWDDYENIDDDQPVVPIDIQWKWSKNHSIEAFKNIKSFIILEGERIRNQIDSDASNIIPICQLMHQKVSIFALKDTSTVICLSDETNLNCFGTVAESIADFINNSTVDDVNVITVNVLPISSYKIGADERLSADIIIRGINPQQQTGVSELMEPNILTGVSAAVASLRHHVNKSFSSYAIYKDSHKTTVVGSPVLLRFFQSIGISSDIFYETYLNDSSLYT